MSECLYDGGECGAGGFCEECELPTQQFNEGYIVEGLDRCHTIMVMIEELLSEHPSVDKAKVEYKIARASSLIGEAYQAIGQLSVEDEVLEV